MRPILLLAPLLLAACASAPPAPPPRTEAETLRLLKDPDPAVRLDAAERCPRPIPPAVRDWLGPLLQDADPRVRVAGCRLLGETGDMVLVSPLITILEDDREPAVVRAAYEAGRAIGQRDGCSRALVTRLAAGDPLRSDAVVLLVRGHVEGLDDAQVEGIEPPARTWEGLAARWTAFLDGNRETLGPTRRLGLDESADLPALAEGAVTFRFGSGLRHTRRSQATGQMETVDYGVRTWPAAR